MRETKTNSPVQEADVTHYQKFEILKYANQFRSHKKHIFHEMVVDIELTEKFTG